MVTKQGRTTLQSTCRSPAYHGLNLAVSACGSLRTVTYKKVPYLLTTFPFDIILSCSNVRWEGGQKCTLFLSYAVELIIATPLGSLQERLENIEMMKEVPLVTIDPNGM